MALAPTAAKPLGGRADGLDEPLLDNSGRSPSTSSYLLVPMLLLFVLVVTAVIRSPQLISPAGIGSAVIVAATFILAAYSLTANAMAGRGTVDLAVGPMIGFINVTLVQLYAAEVVVSPVEFFLYALAVGVAYQVLFALVIIYVRIQPIIVALSGFLALSGINLVILQRPGGVVPEWLQPWGSGETILSPPLWVVLIATAGWLLLTRTAFFNHLRLMGSDERAAYTAGVPTVAVRIGAHVVAGIYTGLAAITFTALISSGDPTQGRTFSLLAITAMVLGGTSLAGGRGGAIGSLLGAVNIYLIQYVLSSFNFGAVQSFVTDLAYGVILVVSLLLTLLLPWIHGVTRFISPFLFFILGSVVALAVILHATYDYEGTGLIYGDARAALETPMPATIDPASVMPFEAAGVAAAAAADEQGSLYLDLAYGALLLLVAVAALRLFVMQVRDRGLSPLVYIVATGVLLLGIYMAAAASEAGAPQADAAEAGALLPGETLTPADGPPTPGGQP